MDITNGIDRETNFVTWVNPFSDRVSLFLIDVNPNKHEIQTYAPDKNSEKIEEMSLLLIGKKISKKYTRNMKTTCMN
jgi:hypothetical protein